MIVSSAPPPIPGEHIDPPLKSPADVLAKVEERSEVAGIGYRAIMRFIFARATLLAAGTTYYLFLSLFALLTLGFGLTARFGADRFATALTDALDTAFPGLTGGGGLDPAALAQVGSGMSIVGLLVLLYSGGGAMVAASDSFHQIYGAPKDGRNIVLLRLRLLAWLLLLAPLAMISFAASLLVTTLAGPILDFFGSTSTGAQVLLQVGTALAALALDFFVLYLMLGHLGGIRPPRRARLIGSAAGAVAIEVLKQLTATIVSWSISKPQYGAFAVPITMLLILYLLTVSTYLAAALTAALAETSGADVAPHLVADQDRGDDRPDPEQAATDPTVTTPGGAQRGT